MPLQSPIGIAGNAAVTPVQPVTRHQLADALHHRIRAGDVIKREEKVQSHQVDAAADLLVDQQGLQFGAEDNIILALVQIQGLDSDPVAYQSEATFGFRPDGESEHAAELA